MIIGLPKETYPGETRVALLPQEVNKICSKKISLNIQEDIGKGSYISNQLYIDNPDTTLYNIIFSIFAGKYFEDDYVENIENKYLIKNHLNFNQIELVYNNECIYIEYINLESDKMDIHINQIDFKIINDNNLFNLNEEYFKYDLRHEN